MKKIFILILTILLVSNFSFATNNNYEKQFFEMQTQDTLLLFNVTNYPEPTKKEIALDKIRERAEIYYDVFFKAINLYLSNNKN